MDILQADRGYECYCGTGIAFDYAASYILERTTVSDIAKLKIAVVSDRMVSGYYYNRFENQFIMREVKPYLIPVESVYTGKSLSSVDSVCKYMIDFDFGSNDWLIALGGGGILDITAFAASIYEGGVNLLLIPTSLESMAEGAVSKYAKLNSTGHKDVAASPMKVNAVICDPSFLDTVPDKMRSNGYASIIRYAILDDLSLIADLGKQVNMREYLNRIYASRSRIERMNPKLLTLGSEIAGAIEGYFRFMNYSEGEALALSLLCAVDDRRREPLRRIYEALGLPTALKDVSERVIMKTLCDRIDKISTKTFDIVDLDETDGGKWVIRSVTPDEAKEIFARRLSHIGGQD